MRIIIAIGMLSGCGFGEEEFATKYSEAVCERFSTCSPDKFSVEYEDVDACKEEWAVYIALQGEAADECEFDSKQAKSCVHSLEKLSCDEELSEKNAEACESVYSCSES